MTNAHVNGARVEAASSQTSRLRAEAVSIGYDRVLISENLSVSIPDNSFTVIVGPNGCGKSTLLRALARLMKPSRGEVLLDDKPLRQYAPKEAAKKLGLLPQSQVTPDGIRVADLVSRGRFAHQGLVRQWSRDDEGAVREAMRLTGVTELSDRFVAELSGGQRQRVSIAMALAQQTDILLLDEPTTFLDLTHQLEVLELCTDLHEQGHTLVAVLHDLNQAARYATHLIVMNEGCIVAEGPPTEILTVDLVERVFRVRCLITTDPAVGTPQVVPLGRERGRERDAKHQRATEQPLNIERITTEGALQ
ncbi:ABC transporter ATP-binding protein [Leucobacter chinensis]|uniref:ABC transporter ATP-binding protein n=1 Tax=Leucobacter chinensis TaxID=2851010 RepID=UPI001C21DFC8|nr:ABC transporter ATP-binding protein [Leucobacter chinensis]